MSLEQDLARLEERLRELERYEAVVGIAAEEGSKYATIAMVNEFGAKIRVTPRMRGYLRATGLPLRSTTEFITIPSRPFFRMGLRKLEAERLTPAVAMGVNKLLTGEFDAHRVFHLVGTVGASTIKEALDSISSPPLHPYTVARKGSSKPLIDTGGLRNRISYAVRTRGR